MVINHNLSAMNAQTQYNLNISGKNKSLEKLSSGYKINRAADNAAGLAISEKSANCLYRLPTTPTPSLTVLQ